MTFKEWMTKVHWIVDQAVGTDIDSVVGDMPFRDAFDAGTSPAEFVAEDVVEMVSSEWGEDRAELLREAFDIYCQD